MAPLDLTSTAATEGPPPGRRLWALAPWLAAAVAILLGTIALGDKSLWFDEAFNADVVERRWREVLHMIRTTEPSQAVYLLLLKPWAGLVGAGDDALLRLPSVVFAAAAAAALVVLGRELFDRWTGLIAGLLLASNAFVVAWSQQARTYSLALLATVVTTLLFVRARRSTAQGWWLAYGAVGAASIWCHFYAGLILLAHAAAFAVDAERPPWRRLAASWGVIGLGLTPMAVYIVGGTRENVEWIPTPTFDVVWSSLYEPSGENALLLLAAALGLAALALGRGAVPARWKTALLAAWVVIPIGMGAAAAVFRPFLVPRFAIVIAPALALLAAVAVLAPRHRLLRAGAGAALVAVAAVQVAAWYGRVPEDWRGAAAYAAVAADRGATVAVLPPSATLPFRRYAADLQLVSEPSGPGVVVIVLRGVKDPGPPAQVAREFMAGAPYVLREERTFGERILAQRWSMP